MTRTKHNSIQRGFALVAALSFTFIVLALGMAVTSMATYERKSTQNAADIIVSRNVAEGGADMAMWQLKQTPTWRCTGSPLGFTNQPLKETVAGQMVTLGRFTVKPITANTDGTISVSTDGLANGLTSGTTGKTKTIGMTAYQVSGGSAPFAYAMLGGTSVKISNSIVTDSYNSGSGAYSAGTAMQNGGVATLSAAANAMWNTNNPTVKGKVITGAGSTAGTITWQDWSRPNVLGGFDTFNSTTYTKSPPTLAPVTAPTAGTAFSAAYTSNASGPGVYIKFNSPAFGNTMDNARSHDPHNNNYAWIVNGPVTLNLDAINFQSQNDLTINGDVVLNVSGNVYTDGDTHFYINSNSSLKIYVGGSVTLQNSFSNTAQRPKDMALIGLPTCTSILLSGDVPFCGYVYAPSATLTTSGSGAISGSLVADKIVCGANTPFHYDESLGAITMGGAPGAFKTKTWEEDG